MVVEYIGLYFRLLVHLLIKVSVAKRIENIIFKLQNIV